MTLLTEQSSFQFIFAVVQTSNKTLSPHWADPGTEQKDVFILHLCLSLRTNKHPVIFYCSPCWVGSSALNQCHQLPLNNSHDMICHSIVINSQGVNWKLQGNMICSYYFLSLCLAQPKFYSFCSPFHSALFGANYSLSEPDHLYLDIYIYIYWIYTHMI